MRHRRVAAQQEVRRLVRMSAIGTVSRGEAAHALGRTWAFVEFWARRLDLPFADGTEPLILRLRDRRVT